MKARLIVIAMLAFFYGGAGVAQAAGTASGTPIVNTATATYTDGGTVVTKTASTTIMVDNKVNLTVTKNADADAIPGATDQALVFVVRNDGNTSQRYALEAINGAGIVLDNVRIYLDNGPNPGALDLTDTLYVDASTFGDVTADGTLAILIVSDTPGTANSGDTSDYHLVATTVDAGTTTITLPTIGPGTAGVDVVFADIAGSEAGDIVRDGKHSDVGTYSINALLLEIAKSAVISSDPTNGTTNPKAIPGATIVYTITVTVTGSGTATNVLITDPIPLNSTYTGGTLTLNGAPLTDEVDPPDTGSVGGAPVNVTVNLGDMTSASPVQTITFEVTID